MRLGLRQMQLEHLFAQRCSRFGDRLVFPFHDMHDLVQENRVGVVDVALAIQLRLAAVPGAVGQVQEFPRGRAIYPRPDLTQVLHQVLLALRLDEDAREIGPVVYLILLLVSHFQK